MARETIFSLSSGRTLPAWKFLPFMRHQTPPPVVDRGGAGKGTSPWHPHHKPLVFDRPLRGRIYDSIAETIGNTPLVRIPKILAEEGITADVVLKLEFFNPISSVKDRIGVSMILDLEDVRPAEAGRHDHRADVRQHRHRPGVRRGGARLQADPDDAESRSRSSGARCLPTWVRNWN